MASERLKAVFSLWCRRIKEKFRGKINIPASLPEFMSVFPDSKINNAMSPCRGDTAATCKDYTPSSGNIDRAANAAVLHAA